MHVLQGADELFVILRRAVGGVVAVPRGDVYPELQPVFPAGGGKLREHIPLPVPPAALGHGVGALWIRPEAEAVVMLGGDDYALHARGLGGRGPLAAVQGSGIEEVFRLRALAPFQSAEGVGPEVDEHVVFHLLPFQLRRRRHGAFKLRRAGGKQNQQVCAAEFHQLKFLEANGSDRRRARCQYSQLCTPLRTRSSLCTPAFFIFMCRP